MAVHRREWPNLPPEPERLAWCDWFARYGVDPSRVALPGWVEADDDRRQIRYLAPSIDDAGEMYVIHPPECDHDHKQWHCMIAKEEAVVQLEARPLPLPA